MFTGIVTAAGRVTAAEDAEGLRRLRIEIEDDFVASEGGEAFLEDAAVGDSIAVDGACLTAVTLERAAESDAPHAFTVELVRSTLDRTIAGGYAPGARVNLERAARLGSRLDGHLVQGHVDGIGRLGAVREEGGTRFLDFELPREVWAQTILHGSITLNGVSLTVNTLGPDGTAGVAIIPHTWQVTNLGRLTPGDPVNVEGDMIGKYLRRMVESGALPADSGVAIPDRGSTSTEATEPR